MRLLRLHRVRLRRWLGRIRRRLMLFGGWLWVAALSLVGVEALEIALGMFVLNPELIPVFILVLAGCWLARRQLRALARRVRSVLQHVRHHGTNR